MRLSVRKYMPSFVSGALLVLCYPTFDMFWLAFIALVPFLVSLYGMSRTEALKAGFYFGLPYFFGTNYWLYYSIDQYGGLPLLPSLGIILFFAMYLSLYTSVFAFLFNTKMRSTTYPALFLAPLFWVVLEYIRSMVLTGFPASLIAYSQYKFHTIIQIADFAGVYGVSYLVVAINGTVADYFITKKRIAEMPLYHLSPTATGFLSMILLVAFTLGYGYYRLHQDRPGEYMTVSVVQGNIPQDLKWDSISRDNILETYKSMSRATLVTTKMRRQIPFAPEASIANEPVAAAPVTNTAPAPDKPKPSILPAPGNNRIYIAPEYRLNGNGPDTSVETVKVESAPEDAPVTMAAPEQPSSKSAMNNAETAVPSDADTPVADTSVADMSGGMLEEADVTLKPDLIVWPESALPFFYDYDLLNTMQINAFQMDLDVPILTGTLMVRDPESRRLFNSAILLDHNQKNPYVYNKTHLVPFGEYVPLKNMLFFLDKMVDNLGDFDAGQEYISGTTPYGSFATLICYEIVFPNLVRKFFKDGGAAFMVTITNDAWFGRTTGPYHHFIFAVFRAVENRKPVIRSANSGISGFIDSNGRIQSATDIFVRTTLTDKIRTDSTLTPYSRFGDLFIFLCITIIVVLLVDFRRR